MSTMSWNQLTLSFFQRKNQKNHFDWIYLEFIQKQPRTFTQNLEMFKKAQNLFPSTYFHIEYGTSLVLSSDLLVSGPNLILFPLVPVEQPPHPIIEFFVAEGFRFIDPHTDEVPDWDGRDKMKELKKKWDPKDILNPSKLLQ